jgi:hypothetical protein
VQSVPSTVSVSDLLCVPILSSSNPNSCTNAFWLHEISSSKARRWQEMSLNFAEVAFQSCYARFFNMP